jgi:hypothetical protein
MTKTKPYGYLCDWGNNRDGSTDQVFYYGEPGSATVDDWNAYPKIHTNLPLYTHPMEWVGLTEDEIVTLMQKARCYSAAPSSAFNFARAIEVKLKEKNT